LNVLFLTEADCDAGGDIGGQPVSLKSNRKLLPHIYFGKTPSEAYQTEELTSSISNEVDNTAGNNSNDIGPQTRDLGGWDYLKILDTQT
jgi:hypothetical protein